MGDLTDKTGAAVSVRVTPKGNAYAIYLDGQGAAGQDDDSHAGATYFVDRGDSRIFHHTLVGDEYAGRGLGSILVGEALADTRAQGLTVVPSCQFVAAWIEKYGYDGPVSSPTQETVDYVLEHAGEA
ncbi:MAG: GNAT family N-acetyltransferase [Mycobacteriaceae bacterium]|uniref:GNAT family N-acetyltransferase n=1 Tax=Corynebacterium sp. TaxID=1720 RepID=UPI003F9878EF